MTKKSKDITTVPRNKSNDIEPLEEFAISEVVSNLIKHRKGNKQDKFYLYWVLGLPTKTSADLAGYKESYGYRLVENFKKKPKVRQRVEQIFNLVPEKYQALNKFRLAELAEIEGLALEEYRKDPKLLISKPQLARQLKQAAGVLFDESPQRPPVVSIDQLNIMQQMISDSLADENPEVVEAEITAIEDQGKED